MGNQGSSLGNLENGGLDFAYNPGLDGNLEDMPMPEIDELDEMFHQALNNMDLTPDQFEKLKDTYNNEEKWKLVQEQSMSGQQVKNTPQYYWDGIEKLSTLKFLIFFEGDLP